MTQRYQGFVTGEVYNITSTVEHAAAVRPANRLALHVLIVSCYIMDAPVNIENMDKGQLKEFLDSFDHIFSDCDGVIWTTEPLPGSGNFIELMREHGKTIHFVSNNSIRRREQYDKLFISAGINSNYENLSVPSLAIADYLHSKNFTQTAYCVTCPETKAVLESSGIKCIDGPHVVNDLYDGFHKYMEDDSEIGAVVFDSDFQVNMAKLYKAITYLKRREVFMISGASDKYVPLKPGSLTLGTGIFTEIVAKEVDRDPIQLGKPGHMFGEFALKRANVTNRARVLFIGDMIEQDVRLGKLCGFKTLLVLTNTTEKEMLDHPSTQPDYYAKSLGSLVPLFT